MYNMNYLDLEFYKLQIFWQLKHNKKRISMRDIPFYRIVILETIQLLLFFIGEGLPGLPSALADGLWIQLSH